jgi:hypothetical protein
VIFFDESGGDSDMKIFISYAREDLETAKKLRADLEKAGIKTWLDKENLLPGQKWRTVIRKEIRECSHFLAVLSSKSLSTRGFVQKELKMALDMLGEFPDDEIFVIPVRIEECEPGDEQLKEIHWADLFESYEKGFQDILRVLSQYRQDGNIPDSQQKKEDVPEKKEAEVQPLKTESSVPKSENKRGITAGDAEKSVLVSGDGNVINIIHQNEPITGDSRRQQLLSQLAAGKIKLNEFNAEWHKLTGEVMPVPKVESAPQPQSPKMKYQRKQAMTVSDDDFKKVFGLNENQRPLEYILNDFKDNNNGTITDNSTGLMWQKSGSPDYMNYDNAKAYIEELNSKKFAGYSDWRLPTVDELKSLLTPKEMNGDLYIDPVFDKTQRYCWTSDTRASGGAWGVAFFNGNVIWLNLNGSNYARAVRLMQ